MYDTPIDERYVEKVKYLIQAVEKTDALLKTAMFVFDIFCL